MDRLISWCNKRFITEDILVRRGISVEKKINEMTGVEERRIIIPYIVNGVLKTTKRMISFEQYHFEEGEVPLYNMEAFDNDILYLTDNEFNAIFISDVCGIKNVVSFPYGKDIIQNEKYFELLRKRVAKFIFVFELIEDGVLFSDFAIDRLGIEHCAFVKYGYDEKDILSVAKNHGVEEAKRVLLSPKDFDLPNIVTFRERINEIYEYSSRGIARGYSTGFRNLDEYFTLLPGSLNMLIGIPSSGKSQFIDAMILNTINRYEWKWCYYSPENLPVEFHFQKLSEMYHGRPMFHHDQSRRLTRQQIDEAIRVFSEHLFIIMPKENCLSIDEILLKIKVCKQRYNINGFVIDPYNELEHIRGSHLSETEYISQFLSKVRNFARVNNLLAFIVVHPTKLNKYESGPNAGDYPVPTPYDASGSANWRNKCDNCLAIWRSYNTNNSIVQVHVQKVRNKNIGKLGVVTFSWDAETGRYSEM